MMFGRGANAEKPMRHVRVATIGDGKVKTHKAVVLVNVLRKGSDFAAYGNQKAIEFDAVASPRGVILPEAEAQEVVEYLGKNMDEMLNRMPTPQPAAPKAKPKPKKK